MSCPRLIPATWVRMLMFFQLRCDLVMIGFVVLSLLPACASNLQQISSRPPNLFDKEMGTLQTRTRQPGEPEAAPEIFVRRRTVAIKPNAPANETGSLFNPDDERNYLFAGSGPVTPGRFVTITVASNKFNRAKKTGDKTVAKAPTTEPTGDKAADKNSKDSNASQSPDDFEQDLIKSLPALEPAAKDELTLIKRFKMRILHRYENGDALAQFTRDSTGEEQANQVSVQARIPYERLVAGEDISTNDLFDVNFTESRGGEVIDHNSSSWEDEYTLRLSGFNEAKSRMAMELDDKRQRLQETKESLQTRIQTLATERQQIAKQRDELNKQKEDTQTKIKNLEERVKTQESTIQDQQGEIEKLKPEDKPGDAKDGKDGK